MESKFKSRCIAAVALGAVALSFSPQATPSAQAAKMASKNNVAAVAMSAPQFSTLVTAVKAAGLPSYLMNTKGITVFAPTNAAFAKLPKGVLQNLLKPENKATLASVLKYHVLSMEAPAKAVVKMKSGSTVTTLNGEKLAIRLMDGSVYLDPFMSGKAKVTQTDIKASNGVIHAIDTVLVPPSVVRAMMAAKG